MYDVITIGSVTQDIFLKTGNLKNLENEDCLKKLDFVGRKVKCFAVGDKVEVDDLMVEFGGGGANTAASFARQGFKTGAIITNKTKFGSAIIIAALVGAQKSSGQGKNPLPHGQADSLFGVRRQEQRGAALFFCRQAKRGGSAPRQRLHPCILSLYKDNCCCSSSPIASSERAFIVGSALLAPTIPSIEPYIPVTFSSTADICLSRLFHIRSIERFSDSRSSFICR